MKSTAGSKIPAVSFYFFLQLELGYSQKRINPNPSPTMKRFGFIPFGAENGT